VGYIGGKMTGVSPTTRPSYPETLPANSYFRPEKGERRSKNKQREKEKMRKERDGFFVYETQLPGANHNTQINVFAYLLRDPVDGKEGREEKGRKRKREKGKRKFRGRRSGPAMHFAAKRRRHASNLSPLSG